MNNIVVYCTVMLGYLEYKIQLGIEKKTNKKTNKQKKNSEGYLTKFPG